MMHGRMHGRAEELGLATAKGNQYRHDSESRSGREAQPVGCDRVPGRVEIIVASDDVYGRAAEQRSRVAMLLEVIVRKSLYCVLRRP
jgi:hypothetical protein